MLRIALVDDDVQELQRTSDTIASWQDVPHRLKAFSSARSLLADLDAGATFSLYLLDVVMPGMDGVELGRAIRAHDTQGSIVYLTTSPDYALQSYDTWPLQYLLKPVEPKRLHEALGRAAALQRQQAKAVLVRTRDGDRLIPLSTVLYAEKVGRRVRYVCSEHVLESVSLRGPFREAVAPLLEDRRFALCCAGIAVNLAQVEMVGKEGATFANGASLPLTPTPCSALRAAWLRYCLE